MVSPFRVAVDAVVVLAIAVAAVPAFAGTRELATAQGTISISEARPGLRAPACGQLVVEARDALDNHLIAETRPTLDDVGVCRYALSVPAQTAVSLRVKPVLVAGARMTDVADLSTIASGRAGSSARSVSLRFTIVATTTYFFEPSQQKTISLTY